MGTKMTLSARAELTNAVRRPDGVATGAERRKILDEFIAVTGYDEKSAIRALNAEPTVKKRQTRACSNPLCAQRSRVRQALLLRSSGPYVNAP